MASVDEQLQEVMKILPGMIAQMERMEEENLILELGNQVLEEIIHDLMASRSVLKSTSHKSKKKASKKKSTKGKK